MFPSARLMPQLHGLGFDTLPLMTRMLGLSQVGVHRTHTYFGRGLAKIAAHSEGLRLML